MWSPISKNKYTLYGSGGKFTEQNGTFYSSEETSFWKNVCILIYLNCYCQGKLNPKIYP